ncbi:MAG: cytochrome P450, partial [Wenzhouxiangella sp.]
RNAGREAKGESDQQAIPSIPTASVKDTLAVARAVLLPMISKGVIIRRPRVLGMAERLDANTTAVECMKRMRKKYGEGPLMLRIPGRNQALVFGADHVRHVLEGTPEPFAPASAEKKAALAHFQPKGVLISHGPERTRRRRFNEAVLGNDMPVHQLAQAMVEIVDEEVERLLSGLGDPRELGWERFENAWFPIVRRVILGSQARDDDELREMIDRLRKDANWAFLHPKRSALRQAFHERIRMYLDKAEPGSLAELIARVPNGDDIGPEDQISHWMFAFDPAGMTTFRGLALLSTHPDQAEQARAEVETRPGSGRQYLPFLRATVLEALRLWPTTPVILRETTRETNWRAGLMPARTSVAIFAPYFHRDEERLAEANRFAPELWDPERPASNMPLVPFSAGTAVCPARHLVLLVASATLAALLERQQFEMIDVDRLDPSRPLPGTLDHFTLRFRASKR